MEATDQPTENELPEIQVENGNSPAVDESVEDAEPFEGAPDPEESIAEKENEPMIQAGIVGEDQLEDEEGDEAPSELTRLKIFISYNRNDTDKAVAERIYNELCHQHDVFLDFRTIEPGWDYEAVTEHWLDTCDFVIALISAKSIETSFIKAELEKVYGRFKRESRPTVIPLRINYAGPSGLRLDAYIGRFQAIFWDNQDYLWLFEQLYSGLTGKLPTVPKTVINAADIIPYGDSLRARYIDTYVEPRELSSTPVGFEEEKLLWITGDAAVRNYVALSLGAVVAANKGKSLYEIAKQRRWTEINSTAVSDSLIVLRDALPAAWLESGAIGEWHSLRAIIERNNIIIATAPDDEFNKLQQELLHYQFTDFQHCHVDTNSYGPEAKRSLFSRLIEHLHEKGELDDDRYEWATDLLKDPNEPLLAGDNRSRAAERRRRDMRRKFVENISRWVPSDIERFVLSLSHAASESDVAQLLHRSAALEDEVRSWFLALDDSTRCFVLALALLPNLEPEDLWDRYKAITEKLRQFDSTLRLLPFGICRKRAHPYVSVDGPIELDDRVADAIRQEIAGSYREYFLELVPQLKEWSVPPGRNPKTVEQRNQRKPKIEETRTERNAIARMVGTVARLGLDDLTDILDYWATDSNIQIRKSLGFAFEQTAKSQTGVNYALNLLERWSLDLNQRGPRRWRALAAAHALGYVTVAANDSYVTTRALQSLRRFARSRQPDARFYASIALRQVARYATLASTAGALGRLAQDDRPEVRINVAVALTEARDRDEAATDALLDEWINSDDLNRRWVALCGLIISRANANGSAKYRQLAPLLENERTAATLADVLVQTIGDDRYGQTARDAFSHLAQEINGGGWTNFAIGLGSIPKGKLEKEVLPLLRFEGAPLFNERAIDVRYEALRHRALDPTSLILTLNLWLGSNHDQLEVFRAMTMVLDENNESSRAQFIAALAEQFVRDGHRVNEVLTRLESMAPAHFFLLRDTVIFEAFRRSLSDAKRFRALTEKYLTQDGTSEAAAQALKTLANDEPPGSRNLMVEALLESYAQAPEPTVNLLERFQNGPISQLATVVHELNYRLIEGAMSKPSEFSSLVLAMVQRDVQTFSILNYLAMPEPQGRRSKFVAALVEARLLQADGVDELLALSDLREWTNLASLAAEVARSYYVRRIFSTRFVTKLFTQKRIEPSTIQP